MTDYLLFQIVILSLQRRLKTIQQLAQMKPKERRTMLRFLDDDQYNAVVKVMSSMPLIDLNVRSEGKPQRHFFDKC